MMINREPTRRDLAGFGMALPVFFAAVGFIAGERTGSTPVAAAVWVLGATITLAYAAVPRARRAIFIGWLHVAYPIGWIVTTLLLVIVYLVVVTPTGLLLRLLGRDPIPKRFDHSARSYWVPKQGTGDTRRYLRQF